jgi:hypothetical protein
MSTIPDDVLKCPLCSRIVALHQDIVSTCHFVSEPADPLWQCAGRPVHRRCFQKWERRLEFANHYNEVMGNHVFADGMRYRLTEDGMLAQVES